MKLLLAVALLLLTSCGKDGSGSVPSLRDDACWCGSTKVACNSVCR
jgi:hypothetical protein